MKAQTIARNEVTPAGDYRNDPTPRNTFSPSYTSMKKEVAKIKDPVSFMSLKAFYRIG